MSHHYYGVGEVIREIREQKDMTQRQLALATSDNGFTLGTPMIDTLERKGAYLNNPKVLLAVAAALGVDAAELNYKGLIRVTWDAFRDTIHPHRLGPALIDKLRRRTQEWLDFKKVSWADQTDFRELPDLLELMHELKGEILLDDTTDSYGTSGGKASGWGSLVGKCGHCQMPIFDTDGGICPRCEKPWDYD